MKAYRSIDYDVLNRMNNVINYIRNHYNEELNLEMLAKTACFSKYHFHRIFRSYTGETLNDFIRHTRLEKAILMLGLDRSKSITEIAFDCGFSSSQNFAKAFKSRFGISPSLIRNEFGSNGMINIDQYTGNLSRNKVLPKTDYLERNEDNPAGKTAGQREHVKAQIIDMPSFHVAYIRIKGYDSGAADKAFATLYLWAGSRGFIGESTRLIGIGWNNPLITPVEKCIYDACITVPPAVPGEEPVHVQDIPGGKCAVHHCAVEPSGIPEEWSRFVGEWALPGGYRPDDRRPGFEIYYNDSKKHALGHLIMDLCLPVKP
jgi:AraC family transcriptional regulator